jgi:hypothetical protein
VLKFTSNECFGLTWVDLLARIWSVARVRTVVLTDCFLATAGLDAMTRGIFALAWSMALLLAEMDPTFQFLATFKPTPYFFE